jgi:hypothetical protein
MRRGLLALCLFASMVLAGCLGPATADWGSGSEAVEVQFSMEETNVKSALSGSITTESVIPVGCTPGDDGPALDPGLGEPVTFTGYLAASQFYTAHDTMMGARGLDFGVTTAVAVQSMPFSDAAGVVDGDGARIDVKDWSSPLNPDTGAGSIDLDELDSDADTKWFILGLIPNSESVLSGMKALNEWHQPVSIQGYLVSKSGNESNPTGYLKSWHATNNECSLTVNSGNNREDLYVLVSGIVLDGATVSVNGESDDEWVQGNVPLLGRTGFLLFFLVGGFGGAAGLFVVSRTMVMRSASQSMQTLIGAEGMKKAASVKSDAKAAKKAGMESPTERQQRMDKESAKAEKEAKKERQATPSAPVKDDSPLGGFDLDSVLASTSTASGPGSSAPTGRKSSVVVTEAAQDMEQLSVPSHESPRSSPPASVGGQQRSTPPSSGRSSGGPPQRSEAPKSKPPVRRRKAVKKEEVVEERPAPVEHHEEEEFSDFSF